MSDEQRAPKSMLAPTYPKGRLSAESVVGRALLVVLLCVVAFGQDIDTGAVVIEDGPQGIKDPGVLHPLKSMTAKAEDVGAESYCLSFDVVLEYQKDATVTPATTTIGHSPAYVRASLISWMIPDNTHEFNNIETTRVHLYTGGYLVVLGDCDALWARWKKADRLGLVPAEGK